MTIARTTETMIKNVKVRIIEEDANVREALVKQETLKR